MEGWNHKDEWRKRGKYFYIVVSRHEVEVIGNDTSYNVFRMHEGPHRWAVYAYIYPNHPLFKKFDSSERLSQPATEDMPLHGGCSKIKYHVANDATQDYPATVTSIQVGADYHHDADEIYTNQATAEQDSTVFNDAQALFDWLTEQV